MVVKCFQQFHDREERLTTIYVRTITRIDVDTKDVKFIIK